MEDTSVPAYLTLEASEGKREISLASGNVWKLGRSDKCAIVIHDDTISRNHAMIQRAETGEYYLIDMGSRNGSFVNGRRVSIPVMLRSDDWVTLGKVRLMFQNPEQTPRGWTAPSIGRDTGTTRILFAQCLVSVLVVDIRDYTGLAQSIDQSILCQLIGSWFAEADRILQKHGSVAQKYIGDAVMALWLHHAPKSEHLEILRILRALSEFAQATAGVKQRLGLPGEFRIGAGLNTGCATVGNPGARDAMDFTAMGDSVNAAFRLETASKELQTDFVLGKDTFDYVRLFPAATQHFRAGEVKLKGYDVPAETWSISFERLNALLKILDTDPDLTHDTR